MHLYSHCLQAAVTRIQSLHNYQPSYLHNLISGQPPHSTGSSSLFSHLCCCLSAEVRQLCLGHLDVKLHLTQFWVPLYPVESCRWKFGMKLLALSDCNLVCRGSRPFVTEQYVNSCQKFCSFFQWWSIILVSNDITILCICINAYAWCNNSVDCE